MKKIMFNDKHGLTEAVLKGRKTMTRRTLNLTKADKEYIASAFDWDLRESVIIDRYAKYKVGEAVAVAQAYKDIAENSYFVNQCAANGETASGKKYEEGWNNKMFVAAYYMPHHIRITDIKVERLQEISEEDCLREGIMIKSGFPRKKSFPYYFAGGKRGWDNSFSTPRKAFAALIDAVSGKGTWERNAYVLAYTFELID